MIHNVGSPSYGLPVIPARLQGLPANPRPDTDIHIVAQVSDRAAVRGLSRACHGPGLVLAPAEDRTVHELDGNLKPHTCNSLGLNIPAYTTSNRRSGDSMLSAARYTGRGSGGM